MFTGIVQTLGTLAGRDADAGDERLRIDAPDFDFGAISIGESIAVNGVCLTATTLHEHAFTADVSRETLSLTTLGGLDKGAVLNLERSLTLAQPLGGHLMSGHVDGVGWLRQVSADARSHRLVIEAPASLARYIARKGSIAVDGISLTVNAVRGSQFEISIVPHTWHHTNLGTLSQGARVNLEIDLVARYLERLLEGRAETGGDNDEQWAALLEKSGFKAG